MWGVTVTMVLGGRWHGAVLNFVLWGGLHGLYLVLNVLWDKWMGIREAPAAVEIEPRQPSAAGAAPGALRRHGTRVWALGGRQGVEAIGPIRFDEDR